MDADVTPEPGEEEREAIVAALASDDRAARSGENPWRRAGLHESVEEADA